MVGIAFSSVFDASILFVALPDIPFMPNLISDYYLGTRRDNFAILLFRCIV